MFPIRISGYTAASHHYTSFFRKLQNYQEHI